ncbi:kinase-like domain-containing protein [Syncephalis fuscata]|nr:kinase-like domain-containing protein [Syncephalis fuscata]
MFCRTFITTKLVLLLSIISVSAVSLTPLPRLSPSVSSSNSGISGTTVARSDSSGSTRSQLSTEVLPEGFTPLRQADLTDPNPYGQDGLVIKKWDEQTGAIATAEVIYKTKRAFLKCFYDENEYKVEKNAYDTLKAAHDDVTNQWQQGAQWVASGKHFFPADNYHCIIYGTSGFKPLSDMSIELSANERFYYLSDVLRQLLLGTAFIHSAMITHNNINWSNVLVNENYKTHGLRITIVNFAISSPLQPAVDHSILKSRPLTGTLGFYAPEYFSGEKYDLRKGDAWGVIVTAYTFYQTSFIGFYMMVDGQRKGRTQSQYEKHIESIYHKNRGTSNRFPIRSQLYDMFDHILPMASSLLTVDTDIRPSPQDYISKFWFSTFRQL